MSDVAKVSQSDFKDKAKDSSWDTDIPCMVMSMVQFQDVEHI